MGITEVVENDAKKFAIFFRKFKTTDIFICQAETLELKDNFLQVLKDVVSVREVMQNRGMMGFYLIFLRKLNILKEMPNLPKVLKK